MATGVARTDSCIFVQNTMTAAVHYAKANDDGHTLCAWRYTAARRRGAGLPYRIVPTLINVPGSMLCERCLPTDKAIVNGSDEVDLSGDE